jgi:DNA polymerase I-like protein with 3'-5' exonuclease and polymerase domains
VHDELLFEVAEVALTRCGGNIQEIMEAVIPPEENRGVPFLAEGKVGKNWGAMEKM